MKKGLIFICLLFFILSCKKNPQPPVPLTFDNLKVEKKIYAANDSTQPYMTLNLDFTYPVAFSNDTILAKIQKVFVQAFAGEDYAGRSPKGAFEAFEKELTSKAEDFSKSMKDDLNLFGECYQTIKTSVVDTTESIITIKTEFGSYMGGAHGSQNTMYYNISPKSGKLIKEKNLFKNYSEEAVTKLILESLTAKYGDSLKDIVFDINDIHPNSNYYFGETGIVYVYNQYEIAPYSEGLIEVTLPYSKINEMLSPKFSQKIKLD